MSERERNWLFLPYLMSKLLLPASAHDRNLTLQLDLGLVVVLTLPTVLYVSPRS